jgi:molecular chaperone IbpA
MGKEFNLTRLIRSNIMGKDTLTLPNVWKDFGKFGVGFDDLFERMHKMHDDVAKNIPNYPPYNIKKTDENTYVIEMAVAGFGKQDITIETEGDKLVIKGNVDSAEEDSIETLWGGLAFRPFTRMFTLNDQVEVKHAEMVNGLLKVALERIIPESKKPRSVEIK